MRTDSLTTTHRLLSLAQQIAISDAAEIRAIAAVLQDKAAAETLAERPRQLATLLRQCQLQSGVSDQAVRKLGADLEMVMALHQLSQLQVNSFANENSGLDPITALQRAIAVPRNLVASDFKANWSHEHADYFNSQFNSNMFSTVGSMPSVPLTQSMAVSSALRAAGPDALRARRSKARPTVRTSTVVSVLLAALALLGAAYVAVRLWDVAELYKVDARVGWLVYRLLVILAELHYGLAALAYTRLSLRYVASAPPRTKRTFTPEALVAILYATDETADTLVAAVMSHTHARRPRRIPIKIVVICQTYTPEVIAARTRVAKLVQNVSFLDHQQLADHEPVTRLLEDAVPIIETMAVPRRMTVAQALYLCLSGLNVKYPLDHVLVSVSDASVIVSQAEHYRHAISRLSRANTAAVSFPCRPRNEPPIADLLDLAQRGRQRVELPAAHAEGHCVVNAGCFAARAPELFIVLRAMELENAGSRTFDWLPFFVHLDPHSAKAAAYDVAAPPCTTLAHKHGRTRLASKVFAVAESWDVAAFLGRQFGARWRWTSGLAVPHVMNRAAVLLEATALVVVAVTAWARVAPAAPANVLLAATFVLYYGAVVASGTVTSRGLEARRVGGLLAGRILVPFFVTVYSFAISRFGVDRRGHFQSVGDITTQQIFGLKRAAADDDGDGVHVPLMALDPALERASLQSSTEPPSSDADSDLWSQEAPDDATLDSWATLGFTAETSQSSRRMYQRHAEGLSAAESAPLDGPGPHHNPLSGPAPGAPVPRRHVFAAGPAAEAASAPPSPAAPVPADAVQRCPVALAAPSGFQGDPSGEVAGGQKGLDDAEISARLAALDDDSGALPAAARAEASGEGRGASLNSLNFWGAPPENVAGNLPEKVSRQEFIDRAAADAARAPAPAAAATGSTARSLGFRALSPQRTGDAAEPSYDMRHWVGDRTGRGIVAGLSATRIGAACVLAAATVGIAAAAAATAARHIAAAPQVAGYTLAERLAASPWDACAILLALLLTIPPLVLLANAALPCRALAALVHNRVSSSALLAVSLLAMLGVPAIHIYANFTAYPEFAPGFNAAPAPIAELGRASLAFVALQATGPLARTPPVAAPGRAVRGESDMGLAHPQTGADLSGGWVTGPGNAKVTHAIALVVTDLALAMIRFPEEMMGLNLTEHTIEQLRNGATYLQAAYNAADGSLVSHIHDGALSETGGAWRRPQDVPVAQRRVEIVNGTGSTEIYALTSAALAASSIVLRTHYDGQPAQLELVEGLARAADTLFTKHVDAPGVSYAAAMPRLAAAWPVGDGHVADEQFYAAAWLAAAFPERASHRNVLNYYFSYSEEAHDWRPCSVDTDSLFVAGNVVMSHFERFDPRYRLHVERCVATWTGARIFATDAPSPLRAVLPSQQLLLRRTATAGAAGADVAGPRPLPLAMRAMAIVAAHAADRLEPRTERTRRHTAAACYSMQQARLLLGYGAARQSFVAGVAAPGASWPRQPRVRVAAGAQPYGAFVHGPDVDGGFVDARGAAVHSGAGVLNSSPMVLLAAAHARMGLQPHDCIGMGRSV